MRADNLRTLRSIEHTNCGCWLDVPALLNGFFFSSYCRCSDGDAATPSRSVDGSVRISCWMSLQLLRHCIRFTFMLCLLYHIFFFQLLFRFVYLFVFRIVSLALCVMPLCQYELQRRAHACAINISSLVSFFFSSFRVCTHYLTFAHRNGSHVAASR